MKRVLFFLALLLTMQTANAQINDIYLSSGVVLSDNQWHFDDYTVIEANNGTYLVITPNNYYYSRLAPFDRYAFEYSYGVNVLGFKPYVYNNCLGWYIQGSYSNYFYNPVTNACITLSFVPVFYDFYYSVQRLRHLNLRYWHWRTAGRYHHLWHPPHHRHDHYRHNPPHNNHSRPPHQVRPPQNNPPRNSSYSRSSGPSSNRSASRGSSRDGHHSGSSQRRR